MDRYQRERKQVYNIMLWRTRLQRLYVASLTNDDGYTVIRFEQRGCGRSDKDGNYDMYTAISDMEAIREYYGITAWIVGGHSWGANLSLAYAIHHSDKTKAILYIAGNGIQNYRSWYTKYHANLDKYRETVPEMLYEFNSEVNKQCINHCYINM